MPAEHVAQGGFAVHTRGRGFSDITTKIGDIVAASHVQTGIVHVFTAHTSCSLLISENADPAVRTDLESWFARAVPDGDAIFEHDAEGPDDMPAHVRAILTGVSLTLPVHGGKLLLGTWQGIYLWEHRIDSHQRKVTVTVLGIDRVTEPNLSDHFPQRIICLTEEPTEVLYALGEDRRIVGISGFTVRPPRARKEKPKVSAFINAKIGEILKLEPDLAIGFSDIQADIARELIKSGIEVWISNHRSVDGILAYIRRLGAMVGAHDKAEVYAQQIDQHIADIRAAVAKLPRRPKVYFEEWDEPIITGIRWVAEIIGIAGGDDCFPELARESLAKQRILPNGDEVVRRAPDIILGSWCGKRFRPEKVAARPGWDAIPAVRNGDLYEIKSPIILQPGPAALLDGLDAIHRIIAEWAHR